MTVDDKPKPEKDADTGRFLTGNNGGGRQKGSRNKLGEAFLEDVLAAWESQGPAVITEVIEKRPQDFLRVVASLLPRDINVNVNQLDTMTDEQLVERIRKLDATIRPFLDAQGEGSASGGNRAPTAH